MQGLKVVGLDARDGPVEAARKAKYPGDILVNPTRVPVEEVVKQVQAAREPGYDYGEGVDGEHSTLPLENDNNDERRLRSHDVEDKPA